MTPEAQALAQVLLDHHRNVCRTASRPPDIDSCTILYGNLCEKAGVPWLTRSVGKFLQEVAEWCDAKGWPPINSLAVNQETHMPGGGYDAAPGCDLSHWHDEVLKTIVFEHYPNTVT